MNFLISGQANLPIIIFVSFGFVAFAFHRYSSYELLSNLFAEATAIKLGDMSELMKSDPLTRSIPYRDFGFLFLFLIMIIVSII